MFSNHLLLQAEALLSQFRKHELMLAAAESCTGGLLSALLTEIAGSSDVFERGFITYSNIAKIQLLGVDEILLQRYGAVSAETAIAMAKGALTHSKANITVSLTGIAGPGGGTDIKPVGLVYIGLGSRKTGLADAREYCFSGSRSEIRLQAIGSALKCLMGHPYYFA